LFTSLEVEQKLDRRRISHLFKTYADSYLRDATNPRFVKIAAAGAIIVMPFNLLAGAVVASAPAIGATLSMVCDGVSRLAAVGLEPDQP
jgi:hypothetical protein